MMDYGSSKYLLFTNYLHKNFPMLYRKFAAHLQYDEAAGLSSNLNVPGKYDEDFEDLKIIWNRFDAIETGKHKK